MMQNANSSMTDNSESQDATDLITDECQSISDKASSQDHGSEVKHQLSPHTVSQTNGCSSHSSSGYYDAEKCRTHIANQIRVSKIDRFALQVMKAIEVESDVHRRLSNILNMYLKRSSKVVYEFSMKCKLGHQRHRQDRILNQSKRGMKKLQQQLPQAITLSSTYIHNDLLYGDGAQLVNELLDQPLLHPVQSTSTSQPHKHIKNLQRKTRIKQGQCSEDSSCAIILAGPEHFEPSCYAKKLEKSIRDNLMKSEVIMRRLNSIRQSLKMAAEHRDKVDHVYTAEEERQASTVMRRSAYYLSMAAIKATSTPVPIRLVCE